MTEVTQGDTYGDVKAEAKARDAVAAMGSLSGVQGPLAEAAYALARILDKGARGMAAAAIARELRETLGALKEAADAGDADSELGAYLSAAVGDAEEPASADARP